MIAPASLISLCRFAGGGPLLAQGGGGNASVKDGGAMWIKASGFRLSEVDGDRGWVAADLAALRVILADPALAALTPAQAQDEASRRVAGTEKADRPSLEALFHALLPTAVLHLHPVVVNALTCLKGGEALAREIMPGAAWVPYAAPGYLLAREVGKVLASRGGEVPGTLLLAGHGLVGSGEDAEAALREVRVALESCERRLGTLPRGADARSAPSPGLARVSLDLAGALSRLLPGAGLRARPSTFTLLNRAGAEGDVLLGGGALTPDEAVYGSHLPVFLDPGEMPSRRLALSPDLIRERMAFVIPDEGVVLAGPGEGSVSALEENLLAHLLIRRLVARAGVPLFLPPAEVELVSAMESERFRQAAARSREGR